MASVKKTCRITGEEFRVFDEESRFYSTAGPNIGGRQFEIASPSLCPDERTRRRLAFRNERFLYKTSCELSGKTIVSCFSPDKGLKACDREAWLQVDNRIYGREFDFNRPFFEQFAELNRSTFKAAVLQSGEMLNSEFTHHCGWMKNCYLMFDSGKSEDCLYGVFMGYCKNCVENRDVEHSELCFRSVRCDKCYNLFCSSLCNSCDFSAFLDSCIGCSHCLGCTNLRNKDYHIFNKKVSKEEFEETWNAVFSGSYSALRNFEEKFRKFVLSTPRRATHMVNCTDSVGDLLVNCENVYYSFNCLGMKNCRYCCDCVTEVTDSQDISSFGDGMEFCYELSGCGGVYGKTKVSNCYFSLSVFYGGHNILYSSACHQNSQDLFGCCDLRRSQYCILNKQYKKEEYEELVPRIIEHMQKTGEWGEFFPLSLSLFGYNESLAQEEYPLTKEEALTRGSSWGEYQTPPLEVKSIVQAAALPDNIAEVGDEILETAIACEVTGKPFRILKPELEFYRKFSLPLPRLHPDVRFVRLKEHQNPRALWRRKCSSTGEEILSSYSPQRPEIVYSEAAYQEAVS